MFKSDFFNDNCDIYGFAYECPLQNRKQDCPLAEIELLNFKEKVGWIDDLSGSNKEMIIKHHLICSRSREHKY